MRLLNTRFDFGSWTLLSEAQALLTIHEDTALKLLYAHWAMSGADDMCKALGDLMFGSSSLQVRLAAAAAVEPGSDPPAWVENFAAEFEDQKKNLRDSLLSRIEKLQPVLYAAIDAVEAELDDPKFSGWPKAADRKWGWQGELGIY